MNLKIPDREPGEESATEKQLNYIRRMGQIDESELRKLGKWQASNLIDQMQIVKKSGVIEQMERSKRQKTKKKNGCLWFVLIAIVGIIAAIALF